MNNNIRCGYEIALSSFEDACQVAKILLKNDYVCMLSTEDDLTIINYEYAEFCNRNNIIFRNLWDWEDEQDKLQEEIETGDCCND